MAKERPKMPMSQRAKQFMTFDALEGYREALQKELERWRQRCEDEDQLCFELRQYGAGMVCNEKDNVLLNNKI